MLSYQHGYHAGNFADVIKHVTLTRLIDYLVQKDKPVFYLETHSGRGLYDLKDSQANKTAEYKQGISLLWEKQQQLPPVFLTYLNLLKAQNPTQTLRYYPGSPAIAIAQFRKDDRLFCCELHPQEFEQLKQLKRQGKRVFFSESDGIHQLKALLPPPERRGLIFIDPAYEIKSEYKHIPQAIKQTLPHFSNGVYCLWYPLVDHYHHQQLVRNLAEIPAANTLRVEFNLTKAQSGGMTGCGLWIANPPYTLAGEMKEALDYLQSLFNPGITSYYME
ncbi:23S rRNA (adenine(2030)-N(6))-methyltransferase RlmJ [Legionella taurinensis]|uniref:Ribosomal RNA large subunit methyltransferase J n=1 Tax=Legionella taurinensis TaxID=70611 RepID=A0A3A5L3B3_9GAMM|nr:23S rRNA (adenine(2030)-N(6))-methyltransferase RlmJ [Legionella taurinensis]RJT46264.1 23S rRNA (adenine(2030)-N(6))-methyltransferase RlmJ [Legionella taurinensis]RJT67019.1 23S rRNA (adenine(2030)-N(6))-methyltransferase RlmJ [Legionella taurinensis]STY26502.1 protein involved in catabolism of external DNA [Legionella taurinensis]